MTYLIIAIYSYLLGSIPSAYVIGKFRNKDITSEGSGNIGGTNAYRVLGPWLGVLVAVMDVGKVVLALTLTHYLQGTELALFVAALSTVIGHNWSIYVGFKGGKGIAVSVGTYFFLFPELAVWSFLVAAFNVLVTKYMSLGSINFVAIMAVLLVTTKADYWFQLLGGLLLLIAVWRHRNNIRALRTGAERRFGQKDND